MALSDELLSFLGWGDSDASSLRNCSYYITLEEKLLVLGRIAYTCHFQELRNNEPVTRLLQSAYRHLARDAFEFGEEGGISVAESVSRDCA